MSYSIKPVESMEEIEGIVNVQRKAWNMEDIGIVPNFETRAVADAGFVYVAIDDKNRVIGFIYGYHHFPHWHYSHMMAVLPEWQGKGVGYSLKKFHREQALNSAYYVKGVKWTVDPLLPNNAYLNFAKLGCVSNTYKVNYYGMPDRDGVEIYEGLPTDRLLVTWLIEEERVARRMENYKQDRVSYDKLIERSPPINTIENDQFIANDTDIQNSLSIQVPANWQEIRRNKIKIAQEWRLKFRDLCINWFDNGWQIIDYHSIIKKDGSRSNYYELSKVD